MYKNKSELMNSIHSRLGLTAHRYTPPSLHTTRFFYCINQTKYVSLEYIFNLGAGCESAMLLAKQPENLQVAAK